MVLDYYLYRDRGSCLPSHGLTVPLLLVLRAQHHALVEKLLNLIKESNVLYARDNASDVTLSEAVRLGGTNIHGCCVWCSRVIAFTLPFRFTIPHPLFIHWSQEVCLARGENLQGKDLSFSSAKSIVSSVLGNQARAISCVGTAVCLAGAFCVRCSAASPD